MSEENRNSAGELLHYDKDGQAYVLDENGNKRPPMVVDPAAPEGDFTVYPTDQGHCGLCGKLTCRGNCFK